MSISRWGARGGQGLTQDFFFWSMEDTPTLSTETPEAAERRPGSETRRKTGTNRRQGATGGISLKWKKQDS